MKKVDAAKKAELKAEKKDKIAREKVEKKHIKLFKLPRVLKGKKSKEVKVEKAELKAEATTEKAAAYKEFEKKFKK